MSYYTVYSDNDRQTRLDEIVRTQNVSYRNAKEIYREERAEERAMEQQEFLLNNPQYNTSRARQYRARVEALVQDEDISYQMAKMQIRIEDAYEKEAKQQQFREQNPEYDFYDEIFRMCPGGNPQSKSCLKRSALPLPGRINYQSLIPFVLEEVRASLEQGLKGKGFFTFRITDVKQTRARSGQQRTFKAIGKLPKEYRQGSSLLVLRVNRPANGIVLASYLGDHTDAFIGRYQMGTIDRWLRRNQSLVARVLGSAITYRRMYEACRAEPRSFYTEISRLRAGILYSTEYEMWGNEFQSLNLKQKEALEGYLAARPGLYLLQGPPGTGKTTTIAALLHYMSNNRERTLVTGPSNSAVQVLTRRFYQICPDARMILLGVNEKIPKDLDAIFTARFTAQLRHTFGQLNGQIDRLGSDKKSLEALQKKAKHTLQLVSSIPFSRLYAPSVTPLRAPLNRLKQVLLSSLSATTIMEFRQHVKTAKIKVVDALATVQKIDEQKLENEYLESSTILFATLSVCGRQSVKSISRSIKHLIVDEAGQTTIAEALIPLQVNPKKCLMVGDPQQLPATVLSQNNQRAGFDASLMHKMVERGSPIFQLTMQYRMHPEIRLWPSFQYYGNRLQDGQNVLSRTSILPGPAKWLKPWAFYNIEGAELSPGVSYTNKNEIAFIIQLTGQLNRLGIKSSQIGIISFYAAQVEALKSRYSRNNRPKISSVDGFQGGERDVIIISCVRANPRSNVGFLSDYRRLNVAATRGKHAVLIVGHARTLEKGVSDFRSLIANAKKRGLFLNASAIQKQWTQRPCRFFNGKPGSCRKGDACTFLHANKKISS